MSQKPKVLCVLNHDDAQTGLTEFFRDACELVDAGDPFTALSTVADEHYDAVYIDSAAATQLRHLVQSEQILDGMPGGVVMMSLENTITWANRRFQEWATAEDVVGMGFYAALGHPEILGPDFCPFHTALATGKASCSTLRVEDHRYYQTHAAPVFDESGSPTCLIVTVRDVSDEMLQQQKLEAIHLAGVELSNLTPEEVFHMEVGERIELLKSNIVHYIQDLLKFDVVEIRLLNQQTARLEPLLSIGIDKEAAGRPLFARPKDNGVTGFVAATGKSYMCEDTTEDPLYLQAFEGAKSSLTVPLILHDQVVGTFNVESPEPRAFVEIDLQFLEIFARDVAMALNTLELMVAQRASTAQESVEAIHGAVALPVDEILNDAVNVMEHYIGHEPEVVERLQRILRNARDIKQVIHRVGRKMAPAEVVPASANAARHAKLQGLRVLVVDDDTRVRNDAHALLDRHGCEVETAHAGGEAIFMVRNGDPGDRYDVIIADISLPDMNGYDFLVKLTELVDPVPLVLMTGFGYDPGHSIVKSRKAGLHPKAVLYKPFRLDQLVETIETISDAYRVMPQA